ncbi:MAG: DUF2281 domain-containing protein [Merismopedia sp. SIO2A8]|nr:DUF2281 domain-containing protein [Symploca sp. SIO2B6]NET47522.1 DUF2281 domain-containing protein [Merismopedia sp. SIO2A8]
MTQLEQQVVETLRSLPLEKQQQVLDFVEFLKVRFINTSLPDNESIVLNGTNNTAIENGQSFADVAKKYIGCVDGGPEDLSTNPKYMEGFGQ